MTESGTRTGHVGIGIGTDVGTGIGIDVDGSGGQRMRRVACRKA